MSNLVPSLIRTAVPLAVGWCLTWLAVRGFDLGADFGTEAIAGITVGLTGLYYAAARAAEERWPWVGILLGTKQAPVYGQPPAQTENRYVHNDDGSIREIHSTTVWPPKQ